MAHIVSSCIRPYVDIRRFGIGIAYCDVDIDVDFVHTSARGKRKKLLIGGGGFGVSEKQKDEDFAMFLLRGHRDSALEMHITSSAAR